MNWIEKCSCYVPGTELSSLFLFWFSQAKIRSQVATTLSQVDATIRDCQLSYLATVRNRAVSTEEKQMLERKSRSWQRCLLRKVEQPRRQLKEAVPEAEKSLLESLKTFMAKRLRDSFRFKSPSCFFVFIHIFCLP